MTRDKKLREIQIAELIFLVLLTLYVWVLPDSIEYQLGPSVAMTVGFTGMMPVELSSVVIGYMISIIGFFVHGIRTPLALISICLSIAGILSYIGELARYMDLLKNSFMLSAPLLVAILDWQIIRRARSSGDSLLNSSSHEK